MQNSNRFLLLAGLFTALIAGVSIYIWVEPFKPCEVQDVQQASAFLTSQLRAFDDLYQFTTTVYREGIDSPLYKLQQIYMNTKAVTVPNCMQNAKQELLDYMRTVIRAFQAFAAGQADATIRDFVNQSNKQYDNFKAELNAVNECAPWCIR
ncbi:MAG TPA: hypothetical protein VFY83_14140 [Anaerolineales bacterium]|nr:hypothetical protein [Anaerolineales bacterium]